MLLAWCTVQFNYYLCSLALENITRIINFILAVGPELFRTYERLQHFEVTKLLELVEKHPNLVLLGDFNTGPAIHNLSWVAPYNYGLMNARGLVSVNSLLCGECTICKDNPLAQGKETILDHVFVPVSLLPFVRRVKVCTQISV